MKASTRALARSRAARRCEYCRLHESDLPLFPFHVEHIIARKHGGTDDPDNLAWSCHHCNLAKSSNRVVAQYCGTVPRLACGASPHAA